MLRYNAPPFVPRATLAGTAASAEARPAPASTAVGTRAADRPTPGGSVSIPPSVPTSGPTSTAPRAAALSGASELSSAGYLWTRCLRDGGVDTTTFDAFQRAQSAIDRSRGQLAWGRGNVLGDAIRTAQASTLRNLGSRYHLPEPRQPIGGVLGAQAVLAADARFMQAGNCAEFTALAQVHLASQLKADEQIEVIDSVDADHTWPELVQRPGAADETRWTVDAWAEGTAMRLEDTRLADTADRTVSHRIEAQDAERLQQRHAQRWAELQAHTSPESVLETARATLRAAGQIPAPPDFDRPTVWRPEIAAALRQQVDAWHAAPLLADENADAEPGAAPATHPLQRVLPSVAAHAVARQFGAGVAEASALAPRIIEAGLSLGDLDRAPDRSATRVAQSAMRAHLQAVYDHLGESPRRDPSRPVGEA